MNLTGNGVDDLMKSVRVHEHGSVDKLRYEDIGVPKIKPDEVLVNIKAASINHMDLWVRKGLPNVRFPLPIILGCDAAGVVAEVGSLVEGWTPGDHVVISPGTSCGICDECLSGRDNYCRQYAILGEHRNGVDAEYIPVPAWNLVPLPKNLSFEEAAAIPLVFLTAWQMLVEKAKVQPGEDVLIMSAGSGVGSAGIQIAKLLGARVIATASTDEKLLKAKSLGADDVVNYRTSDIFLTIRSLTVKKGVDVVFEHIGGDTWRQGVLCLAKGGRLVTCGATSGYEVVTDLRYVFYKQLQILGSTMGSKGNLFKILKLIELGKLRPVIDRVMPMKDVAEAHTYLEQRKAFGKIVLVF
jgi:NADPH:quinone reductase-like Zn-dependent oxidoreductase